MHSADLRKGREYCADLTSFARTVRLLLAMLSAGDPSGARCFARKVAGSAGQRAELGGGGILGSLTFSWSENSSGLLV